MAAIMNMLLGNHANVFSDPIVGGSIDVTLVPGVTSTTNVTNNTMEHSINNDKFFIAFFGSGGALTARSLQINSNNSISISGNTVINANDCDSPTSIYVPNTGSIYVAYRDDAAGENILVRRVTMNANNTITLNGQVTVENGNLDDPHIAYDSTADRLLVQYEEDDGTSPIRSRVLNTTPATTSGLYDQPGGSGSTLAANLYNPAADRVYTLWYQNPNWYKHATNVAASSATFGSSVVYANYNDPYVVWSNHERSLYSPKEGAVYFFGYSYLNPNYVQRYHVLTGTGPSISSMQTVPLSSPDAGFELDPGVDMFYIDHSQRIGFVYHEKNLSNNQYKVKVAEFSTSGNSLTLECTTIIDSGTFINQITRPFIVQAQYSTVSKKVLIWTYDPSNPVADTSMSRFRVYIPAGGA